MNVLKQMLSYLIWIIISFLCAFGYMRIVLGPKPKPSEGFMKIFDWSYVYAMVYVGSIIGIIIAILYVIMDVFYFKKKLKNNPKAIIIRCLIIFSIAITVGGIHYLLEKVIDVI